MVILSANRTAINMLSTTEAKTTLLHKFWSTEIKFGIVVPVSLRRTVDFVCRQAPISAN